MPEIPRNRKHKIFKTKLRATWQTLCHWGLICRYRKTAAHGDKKSALTILKELLVMLWRDYAYLTVLEWGIEKYIWDYFVHRVYRKDRSIDDYVSDMAGIYIMCLSSSLSLKRISLLDNKDTFWEFMHKKGFPVTKRFGHLVKKNNQPIVCLTDGAEATLPDFLRTHKNVFVKPANATKGQNCALLTYLDDSELQVNQEKMSYRALADWMNGDLLMEEVVRQHPALSALHAASLNTLRMVTMRKPDGEIYVECAVQRIGTGSRSVDNFSNNGVAVPVNEDGTLTAIGSYKEFSMKDVTAHPDSHIKFEGYIIPYFKETTELVLKAHRLNKAINGLGWDIAITEEGPLFVEANPYFDFNILQTTSRGYRKLLWERYLPAAQKYAVYSDILL